MGRAEESADRTLLDGGRSGPGGQKRPFQGLRKKEPCTSYDVVVIGAGIGGLFCATLLAKEGLRVLLVEQHYMVGGYCSTFRRKGYIFDAATTFYPLLGNPSTLTGKLLAELGVETRWVKMDPVDAFHFPDGTSFEVPADFDAYRAKLDADFPHQKANLRRFFAAVRETYLKGLLCYFKISPDQLGEMRPDTQGPVDGLHLVGHWVRPGGGITPVIVSAMQVADAIVRARSPSRAEMALAAIGAATERQAERLADDF